MFRVAEGVNEALLCDKKNGQWLTARQDRSLISEMRVCVKTSLLFQNFWYSRAKLLQPILTSSLSPFAVLHTLM